jgi:type II secretory pathway pseudopilin PulG
VIARLARRRRAALGEGGYALTELLTVLVILTIVLGGLTALFISATKAEIDMRARFEAQQEARLAVDALRREVHCAREITPTVPSPTVTITLPTGCPSGSGEVRWCTVSAGTNRYQLFRRPVAEGTCGSAGKLYADYITVANVFSYTAPTSTTRAKLQVDFPVDLNPADTSRAYKLTDGLVLRNTSPTG